MCVACRNNEYKLLKEELINNAPVEYTPLQLFKSEEAKGNVNPSTYALELYWASSNGYLNVVKYVIKNEHILNNLNNDDALLEAAKEGYFDIVKCLLSNNIYNGYRTIDHILQIASYTYNFDILKYALENGADIAYHLHIPLRNLVYDIISSNKSEDCLRLIIQYYQYDTLMGLGIDNMLPTFKKMKFEVILLSCVHDKKLPVELQRHIFKCI